jgi:uncharacterized protein
MKIFLLAIGLLFAAVNVTGAPAKAENDEKTKLSLQLMRAMDIDRMMQNMSTQLMSAYDQQFKSMAKCDEAQPIASDFSKELSEKVMTTLSGEDFKVDIAAVYAEVFTEDELRQSIAFYQSPLGKKLLARMPELMQKSIVLSQDRIKAITPDLQEIGERYGKKMIDACKVPQKSVTSEK